MKSKEEYKNNRGMTILPQPFGTMMFQRLVSKGYIDPSVHIPQLWGDAGVILSSNDSACDIFTVDEIFYHENPFVICDPFDQLCFANSPPFWSLPSETVFVRFLCLSRFQLSQLAIIAFCPFFSHEEIRRGVIRSPRKYVPC